MKVFLQLLKMRILSVFKGSGKKDKYKKNIGFKVFIGIVVAYAALCFVGMFGFYFMQLAENFVEQEVGFAYFSMVAVVMVAIGFVTTVFAAQSQIFEAKDNDLLTAMPIPPRYILLTRVITLLIVELAESLVLGIEAMLIYKIFTPVPVGGAIMMVVEIIGLNMITASISAIFGLVLAAITNRMRRKNIVKTIATIGMSVLFFFLISEMESRINSMLSMDGVFIEMDEAMKKEMLPLFYFGKAAAEGDFKSFIIFMLMAVAVFVMMIFLLSPFFLKITSTNKGGVRKKYRPEKNVEREVKKALLYKERRRFFTNASYMLNTAIGLIVFFVAGVAVLIFREKVFDSIITMSYLKNHIGAYVLLISLFFCAINVISAPSISLEGENLWICKAMPVEPFDILMAKVKNHIYICMPIVIFFGIAANIALPISPAIRAAVVIIPALSVVLMGLLGVICNLHMPKFDWADESIAVKQSMAVIATMGIGFSIVIGAAVLYGLLRFIPYADYLYTFLMTGMFALAISLMYRYLRKGGSQRFTEL